MFRVYDKYEKCWVKDNIFITPNNEIYVLKKNLFGEKLKMASTERYVYHKDVGLLDTDDVLIFEGDMVEAKVSEDKTVTGMVAYAHELAAYVILCSGCDEYYVLGESVCEFVKVVGNVFDNVEDK